MTLGVVHRAYVLRYDASKFTAAAEEIPITDNQQGGVRGQRLARVLLTAKGTPLRDEYRVIVRAAE